MKFSKCKVTTEQGEKVVYLMNSILNMKIENGYKKEIGKTISEIFNLKIISTYENNVRYEDITTRQKTELAQDFCVLTGAKRKKLLEWCKCLSLSDTDILSHVQMKKVRKENDREVQHLIRKRGLDTSKASEVYIRALASQK